MYPSSILPKYALRKKYECLFLFSDTEVYRNDNFNSSIQNYSHEVGGTEITVDVMNFKEIKEYRKFAITNIKNTEKKSLSLLSEIILIDDQSIEDLLGDYYIYDETNQWEFFVSTIMETAIFGCNKNSIDAFFKYFDPYNEISIEEKLKDIYDCFRLKMKEIFLSTH